MMTTKCQYCTSALCIGCQHAYHEPYTGKFFKGYEPQFYFHTLNTCDTKTQFPDWMKGLYFGR